MKLIRKNVRSRIIGKPIDQQIILRSAVQNIQTALEEDPFQRVRHRTYVIQSRSKSLQHTQIRTFQKSKNQQEQTNKFSIKRVFNLQNLSTNDIQITNSHSIGLKRQSIQANRLTQSTLTYLERQKMRLQKQFLIKKELKMSKKKEVKKKFDYERRERQLLKQIKETKQQQKLRNNNNFIPLGLQNLGNTCYLNSVLQCFLNLPLFNQYFYGGKYLKDVDKDKTATDLYAKLLFQMQTPTNNNKFQSPQVLKKFMGSKNSRFSGTKQQDCTQFLTLLLSLMNKQLFNVDFNLESMNRQPESLLELSQHYWIEHLKKQNSHITKYFGGQIVSTIFCNNCSSSFQKFDHFYDIQLSFNHQNQSLESMFTQFIKPQYLDDYRCPICNQVGQCYKQLQITKIPLILIIQLKRFKPTLYGFQKQKRQVNLSLSIDLSNYILKQTMKSSLSKTFELWSFSKHFGQISHGHYTTESKSNINSKWFDFNDSRVTQIVRQKEIKSKEAYVLFYVNQTLLWLFYLQMINIINKILL